LRILEIEDREDLRIVQRAEACRGVFSPSEKQGRPLSILQGVRD
jgi:hypothetical protein